MSKVLNDILDLCVDPNKGFPPWRDRNCSQLATGVAFKLLDLVLDRDERTREGIVREPCQLSARCKSEPTRRDRRVASIPTKCTWFPTQQRSAVCNPISYVESDQTLRERRKETRSGQRKLLGKSLVLGEMRATSCDPGIEPIQEEVVNHVQLRSLLVYQPERDGGEGEPVVKICRSWVRARRARRWRGHR
jgi:hypothetical protein